MAPSHRLHSTTMTIDDGNSSSTDDDNNSIMSLHSQVPQEQQQSPQFFGQASPLDVDTVDTITVDTTRGDRIPLNEKIEDSLPIISMPPPSPSPSPLERRTLSSSSEGRRRDKEDDDTTTNNNTNIRMMMMSPPLLKRRAFSHDYEPRLHHRQSGGGGEGDAEIMDARSLSLGDHHHHHGGGLQQLRTIPSRCEMDDSSCQDDESVVAVSDAEARRRLALYATPRRGQSLLFNSNRPTVQNSNSINAHRNRALSSNDVVLNMNECLPRYDDELASRIANISDKRAGVDQYQQPHEQAQSQPQRGGSFLTPERPLASSRPSVNRGRANTCPHRPQRHSIFFERQEDDEESGSCRFHVDDDDGDGCSDSEMETTPDVSMQSSRSYSNSNNNNSYNSSYNIPLYSGGSPVGENTPLLNMNSPERRRRRTVPASVPPLATGNIPNNNIAMTPSSSARRSSALRPTLSDSLSSSSVVMSTPNNNNVSLIIPNSPQPNVSVRLSGRSNASALPAVTITTTQQQQHHEPCMYRINPYVMKLLMILSLYMLLAYTWNTDLRSRYKSAEINYGLSEYWNGGLSRNVEKIGREPMRGKLFNDDNRGGVDDDKLSKLMNSLRGEESESSSASASASGDVFENSEDGGSSSSMVLVAQSGGMMMTDKKKRRPSLSHARSISDASHPAYRVYRRAQKSDSSAKWTLSRMAWAMVWIAFMLPIVEASIREIRRQLNFRFWNVRRLRSFRAMPSSGRVVQNGGGGRVVNVHNL